jgi:ferredoxin
VGFDVAIDDELCISSGTCVATAPDAFAFDDDGIARLVPGATLPDDELLSIARNCPSGAIVLRRDGDVVDL